MSKVILLSGGIDSYLTWRRYPDAIPVFVDIGQPYLDRELEACNKLCLLHKTNIQIIKSRQIMEVKDGIIPLRNAELILAASVYGNDIMMGVLYGEINSDKSEEFFIAIQSVLNISWKKQYWTDGRIFTVSSPIRHLTKTELISEYLSTGGRWDNIKHTLSCYAADGTGYRHCGSCPSCFKRWVALTNNNLSDKFSNNPIKYASESGILRKCKNGTYEKKRATEILSAVEMSRD